MKLFFYLVLWGLFPQCVCASQTPYQVLTEVQRAIDTRNISSFSHYVDIDALAQQTSKCFFDMVHQGYRYDKVPFFANLFDISKQNHSIQEEFRILLTSEIKLYMEYGVVSGLFAGGDANVIQPSGILVPLFVNLSKGRKEILLPKDKEKKQFFYTEQQKIDVPIAIKDHANGKVYNVVVGMVGQDGTWRVYNITNLKSLMGKNLEKEHSKRKK